VHFNHKINRSQSLDKNINKTLKHIGPGKNKILNASSITVIQQLQCKTTPFSGEIHVIITLISVTHMA
jgi:hypothetical protein